MAAFGLKPDKEIESEKCWVWAENWVPLMVFSRLTSQLIVSPGGGVIGVRYESIPVILQACKLSEAEIENVWDVFQIMERHMVRTINDKK